MRAYIFSLLIVLTLSVSAWPQKSSGIEGVWSLTEVTTTGPNASSNKSPQPSVYIFTKSHYSIMYVAGTAPRENIADLSKATTEQVVNVFVNSFIANSGTYEYKSGKLTVHPTVAKSPGFMQPGSFADYTVTTDGKTMTLVSAGGNAGPSSNPTTYKLTRVE